MQRRLRPPGSPVHGTLCLPRHQPVGGVVVIGGSGGSEPVYVAQPLAAEGWVALSVAYFARQGLPEQLRAIHLEYFQEALRLVTSLLPTREVPVAVLGMSRGAEAALLTAVHSTDRVDAVVAAVPSNVVTGSWPVGGPAWLLGGKPLPYVDQVGPASQNLEAVIPVESIAGPLLTISAGKDRVWPSVAMSRAIARRRCQAGRGSDDVHLEYADAGHSIGYLVPHLPPGLLPDDLSDGPAEESARAGSWPLLLQFLRAVAVSTTGA